MKGTGGTENFALAGSTATTTNRWYNTVFTWDGTTGTGGVKVYLDGLLDGSGDAAATVSTGQAASYVLSIGTNESNRGLVGTVPIFSVYDRALTGAEVLQNYNAQRGRFGV